MQHFYVRMLYILFINIFYILNVGKANVCFSLVGSGGTTITVHRLLVNAQRGFGPEWQLP